MADSNRTQLAFVEEASWGTTPATALTKVRFTDENMGFNVAHIASSEIRSDRQTTDLVQSGADCSGGFGFELSYGGCFHSFFEGALWNDWVGVGTGSTEEITSGAAASGLEFTLNATADTITLGATVTHGIVIGQWIELSGSDSDDGYHLVTDVSGQVITVNSTPGITVSEVLDNTDAATIRGSYLRNGTLEKNYTIERYHADKGYYFPFLGMTCNSLSLTVTANAIVTGNFDFIGQSASAATATAGSGAYAEATSNAVMNALSNVADIMEGSTLTELSGIYIQELNFTLNNNVRGQGAIGNLGYVDVGVGQMECTGGINVYFEDADLYTKYLNNTATGISFKIEDSPTEGAGNAYIFTWPKVKFATNALNTTGSNTDVMENITWQAYRHSSAQDYTMQICRVPVS